MNGNGLRRGPLSALAVYNPALLKKEDLVAQFVARRALLEQLTAELRNGAESGEIQHQLLIGQRGSGKTTLLRRLRYAIEDDGYLTAHWLPLVFPEEQYNVARISDFWANCLDALSDALEREGREAEVKALDNLIENLPGNDEKGRARMALDSLKQWTKRERRGLVLLLDNSDLIFDRLTVDHWALREALSADGRLAFICATSAPIEATYRHEGVFYDFFKVRELPGIGDEEAREVLSKLAQLRRATRVEEILKHDPGRLRSLRMLTGGNLRTLVVLFQILAQGEDDSVRADLEHLLDQYTPLYKARFEALSAQSQQVFDALALNWDPITAAELASALRLETNAVSAVLNRLVKEGVIEKVASPPGAKTLFQVAERFFNIWYLMRASRRVRRKLIWLVEFLKLFYGSEALRHRAMAYARQSMRDPEMALAYARAIPDDPALRRALETGGVNALFELQAEMRQSLRDIFDFNGEDAHLKPTVDLAQTLSEIRKIIYRVRVSFVGWNAKEFYRKLSGSPSISIVEKRQIAKKLHELSHRELRQIHASLDREEKNLSDRFGQPVCKALMEAISQGLMRNLQDVEGADAAAIRLNEPLLKAVARGIALNSAIGWNFLGDKFISENNCKDAEWAYRKAVEIDPGNAYLWNSLGVFLSDKAKRHEEAEAAYREAIELKPEYPDPWKNLGLLSQYFFNRPEEAEAAYRKALEIDPNCDKTWNRLGLLLQCHLKRYDEAEIAYRNAIQLAPASPYLLNNLGLLLQDHLKRHKEAEAAYRQAIKLDPHYAYPWNNLGLLLQEHFGRYEEAEAAYRRALEIDATLAALWNNLGTLLDDPLKRHGEAEIAYRKAIEIDPRYAPGKNGLACHFYRMNNHLDEAESLVREAISLDDTSPNIWHYWHTLASILTRQGKWDEAEPFVRRYLSEADDQYHEEAWGITLLLLRDAITTGHTRQVAELLEEIEFSEKWRPLYEALLAVAENSSARLLSVAPEIRRPAEEIIARLLPEGMKLSNFSEPIRGAWPQRKRSLSWWRKRA